MYSQLVAYALLQLLRAFEAFVRQILYFFPGQHHHSAKILLLLLLF